MTTLLTYKFTVTKEELMDAMRNKNRGPELEDAKDARIADLELQLAEATHLCAMRDAVIHDIERQLAEATTWRSPETAPRDGTEILAYLGGCLIKQMRYAYGTWSAAGECFHVEDKRLHGWLPLPETKKEDV